MSTNTDKGTMVGLSLSDSERECLAKAMPGELTVSTGQRQHQTNFKEFLQALTRPERVCHFYFALATLKVCLAGVTAPEDQLQVKKVRRRLQLLAKQAEKPNEASKSERSTKKSRHGDRSGNFTKYLW